MTRFLVVLGFLLLATGVVLYNRLIRSRNRVDTAWSDIDVQLQRRHDLIPNLVKAVDQYARYERATLEAVTELRAEAMHKTGVEERGEAEQELSAGVQRLLAVAEQYPDLKAAVLQRLGPRPEYADRVGSEQYRRVTIRLRSARLLSKVLG
jgi:LemA protein